MCQLRLIIMLLAGALLATAVAGLLFVPLGKDKPLVNSLFGGQQAEPDTALRPVSERARPTAGGVNDGPDLGELLRPLSTPYAQQKQSDPAPPTKSDPLPPAARPFVGRWGQTSDQGVVRLEVELDLRGDGTYDAAARVIDAQVSDGPPPRSFELGGTWTHRGGAVVLTREHSSDASLFPVGATEMYWSSTGNARSWTYTDAEGLERTFKRVRDRPQETTGSRR